MTRLSPLTLALLVPYVLTESFPPYVQFQGNSSGPSNGLPPAGYESLQTADTRPNASHTVSFNFPDDRQWDWRLQISEAYIRGVSNDTSKSTVAFTTWHLSLPDNDSQSASSSSAPTCAYLIDADFPPNVSTEWDQDSASCTPAIGSACEKAILDHTSVLDDCSSGNTSPLGYLDACEGSLGDGGFLVQGLPFDATNVTDGTWAYALTAPYNADDANAFRTAEERLRIMVLTGPNGKGVFCNRVARDVDGKGGGESNSENADSGAATYIPQIGGLAVGVAACWLTASWL